jgi:PknH-like extracellular domain
VTDQDDPDKRITDRERQHAEVRGDEAGKGASANALGLGLVLVGAVATAIAMFLPFAQPVDGLPILGKNTLFQLIGWQVLWPLFFILYFGYSASQGKRFARWSLIGLCVLAAVGVVALATDKDLRTMHIIGPGGAADSTGPGILAGLAIAVYVAAAGVAVAIVGALALFQSAGDKAANIGSTRQRNTGVRETGIPLGPEAHPQPEQTVLGAESSAAEVEAQAAEVQTRAIRSRLQSTWPLIAAIVVVAVAVAGYFLLGRPSTTSQSSAASQPSTSLTPAQTALEGLLLSADQINTAMGTTVLTVQGSTGAMPNVAAQVPDTACRPIVSPAEAEVYEGSGWSTMLGQALAEPGPRFRHRVEQTVVSFPSAKEAVAFFTASAQSWPACADRKFTVVAMGTNMPHTAGPVSNTNGTLSVTQNQDGVELVFSCHRALTVANNIVVDVMACSLNQTDAQSDTPSDAAINIAHQIAAKVPAT